MTILVAPGPTTLQLSAVGPDGRSILVVLAKRTYAIGPSGSCTPAREQLPLRTEPLFDPDRRNLLIADVETYPWKELSDVVVRGHVYPYESSTAGRAEVVVGPYVKSLAVVGDRRCAYTANGRIVFSSAEPFEKIPLEYDRAYGGWDDVSERRRGHPLAPLATYVQENTDLHAYSPFVYPRNRHGRGYVVEASPERVAGMLLPNLEDPAEVLTPERLVVGHPFEWNRMPLPACTTWVPPSYFGRGVFLGMFPFWQPLPQLLAECERGLLPRAVSNVSVFQDDPLVRRWTNGASLGLQVPHLQPRTKIVLVHLHPRAARLELQLPDDTPRIAVDGRNGKLAWTEPVIHHVEIEPDEGRLSIVWRGAATALRPYLPTELETMPLRVEWRE
jgi:hypothetical protein